MDSIFADAPLVAGEFPIQAHIGHMLPRYWGTHYSHLCGVLEQTHEFTRRLQIDFGTDGVDAHNHSLAFNIERALLVGEESKGAIFTPLKLYVHGAYRGSTIGGHYAKFGQFLNSQMLHVKADDADLAPEVAEWLGKALPMARTAAQCHQLVLKTAQRLSRGRMRPHSIETVLLAIEPKYRDHAPSIKAPPATMYKEIRKAVSLLDIETIRRALSTILQAKAVYAKLPVKHVTWKLRD